jgi:hypothetical protein
VRREVGDVQAFVEEARVWRGEDALAAALGGEGALCLLVELVELETELGEARLADEVLRARGVEGAATAAAEPAAAETAAASACAAAARAASSARIRAACAVSRRSASARSISCSWPTAPSSLGRLPPPTRRLL